MTTEWREIPGWPDYVICRKGRVRKADTGYELVRYGRTYRLRRDGAVARVPVDELLTLAFPVPRKDAAVAPDGFTVLEHHPGYAISRAGDVISLESGEALKRFRRVTAHGELSFVHLGRARRSLHILLYETFGAGTAAAVGLPEPEERRAEMSRKRFGRTHNRLSLAARHVCHDCGRPTPDYRCPACWRKLRGFDASEAANHETPFDL